jgi:hypothetical protein
MVYLRVSLLLSLSFALACSKESRDVVHPDSMRASTLRGATPDSIGTERWTQADPPPETVAPGFLDDDPSADAFRETFKALIPVGRGRDLLLPTGKFEEIDAQRSALPRTNPVWQAYEEPDDWMEDRVLAALSPELFGGSRVYVLATEGGSGDPGFRFVRADGINRSENIDGDILAIPSPGEIHLYQRTNSLFPRHRRFRLIRDSVVEVPSTQHRIGLKTVALARFRLRKSFEDSTLVAWVEVGDSVEVVEAREPGYGEDTPFLVKTAGGGLGWVRIGYWQCNLALMKGICFYGD